MSIHKRIPFFEGFNSWLLEPTNVYGQNGENDAEQRHPDTYYLGPPDVGAPSAKKPRRIVFHIRPTGPSRVGSRPEGN